MYEVAAFESAGAWVAGGVVIAVDDTPALEVAPAFQVVAVAAGAPDAVAFVGLVLHVNVHFGAV